MKRASGVHPVRVYVARTRTEADLVVAFLEEKGVPARIDNAATHEALDGVAPMLEQSGGFCVMVASDVEAAAVRAVAEFRENAPLEEDAALPDDGEE